MKSNCPTASQWELFLADRLSSEAEADLDGHLQSCSRCQAHLERTTNPASIPQVRDLLMASPERVHFTNHLQEEVLPSVLAELNSASPQEPELPNIPGYEVLDRIGEGGSSIVYQARDAKLQRIVAIKILRSAATPVQRQRFEQEARALASLKHPNIAGIIEVGEANGHPYLVLEYISGGSLARYLSGRSQTPLECARLVQQLACAVQQAHDTGIIHRDLKPGNVLLDPHFGSSETEGLDRYIPKLIDYGIAKDLESPEDFTNTRDFLGTPSYMAPEQVTRTKAAIDHRTDVYALGIILYEMLTGRPPFRAASPIDTMLQIKHEDPIPPSRFEPKLPRDLENICLKCFEKDPARRYQSAQLLADDLDRFLQGRPVLARPIPHTARLWRWSRRNPAWAIASVFTFLILVTLAIVGPLWAHYERTLREDAARSAEQAAIERNRARDHLNMAGQALEEMFDQMITNARLQDSAFNDLQKSLVTFAMPYLEQFVQQEVASERLRLRQARALLQLATVQVKNNELDKAQGTYQRSLGLLEDLHRSVTLPAESTTKALSAAYMEFGRFLDVHRNQSNAAESHYRQSLALLGQLNPVDVQIKHLDSYAIINSLLAALMMEQPSREGEALQYVTRAARYRDQLLQHYPERDDLRHYAAMAHMNMAIHFRKLKQFDKDEEQLRLALALEQQVNQSKSQWVESPFFVSTLQGELGMSLALGGKRQEALQNFRNALKTAEALVVVYPGVEKYAKLAKQWAGLIEHYQK